MSRAAVIRTSVELAALDIEILREMYRERAVSLAGIDPRLNATQVARRLRVGRARVASRLKAWEASGFLQRYDVWLNPVLLDWTGAWLSVRVDHPRSKGQLFRRLSLVDGAISALEFLGEWLSVAMVAPDERTLARRVELLRSLTGVREVETPFPWSPERPRRSISPLDLRIIRALRERPTARLSDTARRVGISTRTMTRKYADLVNDRAVWFVPVFDFTAIAQPVVSLNLTVDSTLTREVVARALRRRFPLLLNSSTTDAGVPLSPKLLIFFVVLNSAAQLDDLTHYAGRIEGVLDVETFVMVRMYAFHEWFDRHLDTLRPAGTPRGE